MASNGENNVATVTNLLSQAGEPAKLPQTQTSSGLAQFSQNPFFTAGAGLALLGAGAAFLQKGIRHGASFIKRRMLVDVEITNRDAAYPWFLHWMTAHQRLQMNGGIEARGLIGFMLRRIPPKMHHLSISTTNVTLPTGATNSHFSLEPGPGKHLLYFRNALILVDRQREARSRDFSGGSPWETVTMTTLWSHRRVFEEIFSEAHYLTQRETEGKIILYNPDSASWKKYGKPRRKRPLESVILDEGIKERILDDVHNFTASSKWYFDRGIPYRRGYLLHGPPGSGKTSFIQALAGELDYSIALLSLSERGMTDDRLNRLLEVVPERTLVLLEDADAAFANRRTQTDEDGYRGANVTFSGLLNALDGVASAEERILFLTTNHIERMDDALIRPGRVDMVVYLGDATRWQVERFWRRFYGEQDTDRRYEKLFLDRLEGLGMIEKEDGDESTVKRRFSTAALQGLFLYNKDDMEGALASVEGLLPPETKSSESVTKRQTVMS